MAVTFLTNEDKAVLNGQINTLNGEINALNSELANKQQTGDYATNETVDEVRSEINTLGSDKVTLPKSNGVTNHGIAGQFAVSDGVGGIMWKTLVEAEEVAY